VSQSAREPTGGLLRMTARSPEAAIRKPSQYLADHAGRFGYAELRGRAGPANRLTGEQIGSAPGVASRSHTRVPVDAAATPGSPRGRGSARRVTDSFNDIGGSVQQRRMSQSIPGDFVVAIVMMSPRYSLETDKEFAHDNLTVH
jgi:hypothetical protein